MRRHPTAAGRALAPAAAIVVLSLLSAGAARAQSPGGPWVQTKDGYYATARLSWSDDKTFFDSNGDVVTPVPEQRLKSKVIELQTEYGISNKMTLHLGMPVEFLKVEVPAANFDAHNSGFGDLLFGLKYGFMDPEDNAAVSLEGGLNLPTGYNSQGYGIPPLGRGKASVDGHVRAGLTLDPTPAYGWAEVGYRHYTDSNVSDAIVYGAEAGVWPSPRVLVLGHLDAEHARDDAKPLFLSYTRAEGLVQYGLKRHLDVMAGYRRTLSGKRAGRASELRIGIALKGNHMGRYRGQSSTGSEVVHAARIVPVPAPPPAAAPAPVPPPPAPAPTDTTQAPGQPK